MAVCRGVCAWSWGRGLCAYYFTHACARACA